MELVAAPALRSHQAGLLEYVEVLRNRLPAGADAVTHDQPTTDLEEGLAVAIGQFIEDCPSGWVGEGPEDLVVIEWLRHGTRAYASPDLPVNCPYRSTAVGS